MQSDKKTLYTIFIRISFAAKINLTHRNDKPYSCTSVCILERVFARQVYAQMRKDSVLH